MLDVNCEWHRDDAVRMAQRFKRHHLHWLEEPVFPPEDFAALRAVGESGVATAAGENLCFATQFAALFAARAVRFAQPSVTKVGAVTEFLKVVVPEARFEHFYLWPEAPLYPGCLEGA